MADQGKEVCVNRRHLQLRVQKEDGVGSDMGVRTTGAA